MIRNKIKKIIRHIKTANERGFFFKRNVIKHYVYDEDKGCYVDNYKTKAKDLLYEWYDGDNSILASMLLKTNYMIHKTIKDGAHPNIYINGYDITSRGTIDDINFFWDRFVKRNKNSKRIYAGYINCWNTPEELAAYKELKSKNLSDEEFNKELDKMLEPYKSSIRDDDMKLFYKDNWSPNWASVYIIKDDNVNPTYRLVITFFEYDKSKECSSGFSYDRDKKDFILTNVFAERPREEIIIGTYCSLLDIREMNEDLNKVGLKGFKLPENIIELDYNGGELSVEDFSKLSEGLKECAYGSFITVRDLLKLRRILKKIMFLDSSSVKYSQDENGIMWYDIESAQRRSEVLSEGLERYNKDRAHLYEELAKIMSKGEIWYD